jgi:hypothetical protein
MCFLAEPVRIIKQPGEESCHFLLDDGVESVDLCVVIKAMERAAVLAPELAIVHADRKADETHVCST